MKSGDIITRFNVPGKPIGKKRPAGATHRYKDNETKEFERTIGWAAKAGMKTKLITPQAVGLDIAIYVSPPKMWKADERRRALKGEIRPVTTPDTDNVLKTIMDGCSKVAYKDDRQVSEHTLRRTYSTEDSITVTVYKL